jgi:hypothetical protein
MPKELQNKKTLPNVQAGDYGRAARERSKRRMERTCDGAAERTYAVIIVLAASGSF